MLRRSEHITPGLAWDSRVGAQWCRCYNQSCYGRILGEDEVDITWVHEWGSVNSFGRAKCKVCGAEYIWDFTDNKVSLSAKTGGGK